MSRVNMNATACIGYLRRIGVEVRPDDATAWVATEHEYRARRRAHNRELKKSCGHFSTHETKIISDDWSGIAVTCNECRRVVKYIPNSPHRPPRGRKPLPERKTA
jgi:hypothetical protein